MNNQVTLVGRLVADPEHTVINDRSRTTFTLAVNRNFKNQDGEYETDFVRVILWNGIAENVSEYCHKGDLVGIHGRIQTSKYEKDGETIYATDIIAERVTFLSSKRADEK